MPVRPTWSANERVSDQGFVPNFGDQFGGGFIGDSNGIAASSATAHPVWTGYRGQDQDIFYAPISGVPNDPPTADAGGPHVGTEDLPISGTALALNDPAVIEAVAKGTVTALAAGPAITPADFKVAFVGDTGAGSDFRRVLQLIGAEGTDMVMQQGDLGYSSGVSTWDQVITDVLGADFPYFASKGNHDSSWSSYQQVLRARMALVPGASCSEPLGIQSSCTYQGLFFILSGVGESSGPIAHDTYIRQQLAQDNATWSVCSWHKNQSAMQVGGKGNSTGWGVYEECRIGGAMVATAHEHSYSRTRTLTSTSSQIVDPEWPQADETRLAEGSTVVFVSGLGGRSIRNQDRCSPSTFPYGCNGEWASSYTSDQGADFGALFCSFHVDGQPNKAHCYFKDISGNVPDEFNVTSFLGAGLGSPPVATPDSATTDEDTPVDTDVLFNDSDPDPGDTLLLLGFDSASANGGVVTRLDNGTSGDTSDDDLRYTPAQDFNGVDSYSYDVSDGVYTSSAIVTVTVDPIEDPPVAVDDPDFTPIDTPVTTDVLANDFDPDGDTVLLQSFDAGSANAGSIALDDRGTATASDDRLIYSSPSSFEGVDSYNYTVTDGKGGFATATVTITVADNLPPLAVDDPETTAINTAVTTDVLANDSEPEGDPLFLDSFDAVSTQDGTVSRDDGGTPGSTGDDQLVYTPPTDFVGVDTYGYTVADDKGGFASATVTVNVLAPDIVFERRVSTGNDDAEESSSGSVNLSSSDLELTQESSTQTIGIRFQNVGIPPEATVVNAWLQFQADESHSGGTSLTIAAQASANPGTFSSSSGSISSRPRLTETVSWSPPAWSTGNQGPAQQTPNLAPVIQAVVTQQNWTSGNSLVIIITGSGKRVAESYNGSSSAAALLHVEYATGPPPNTPPVVNAGGDQTVAEASVATATLDATVTDDGLPASPGVVTTLWEQTGGPTGGVATFTDATAIDTTVTFSISILGTYTLRLTADDGEWQPLPFDEVTITVAVNQAPTVSVAAVPPVTLPSAAVLDGTVTDDGLPAPATIQWSGSGPGTVTFGDPNAVDTTASFSTSGTYMLRLTATDVDLGDYFAEVTVEVLPPPPGPQTIFFDDLQQNEPFTLWVESNEFDWTVKAPEEKQVPGSASGNRVGHADNCDNGCFLTLAQTINLSPYESATLSFWRYVDTSLDSGEYLRVEISDGSAWITIFEWTHGSGDDDQWHLESYDIPVTHLVAGFSLRFVSRSSSTREDNEIDDVLLEGMLLIGGNYRPVADAGSDQTVTDQNGDGLETVTLDGSASSDPEGQIVDWEWAEGGNVLGNGETLDAVLLVGNYTVSLTVTDDGGATATDEVLVRVLPQGGGDPTILEVRVSTGNDDAEEQASGSVGRSSSDLELVQESSTQTVGIRFQGVDIPPGAVIVNAWLQFQADESHSGGTSLTIAAQASANPVTFSSTNGNISSRPRLTETVSWSPPAWSTGAQGPAQQTPDLALVIQAVVNQQNWTSGNSLVIIITGSGKRVAESYNGSSSAAALLHVEYY